MLSSLSSRVIALGMLVVCTLIGFALLLAHASGQSRDSFVWVTHSAAVIDTAEEALTELRDAESGQRGFVISRNADFAQSFEERVTNAQKAAARLVTLTADNRIQNLRAREFRKLLERRIDIMRKPIDLARRGKFDEARSQISVGLGRELMERVALDARTFLLEENALQTQRIEVAGNSMDRVRNLALIGGPVIALLVLLVCAFIIQGIRRPVDIIHRAMTALGNGERSARISETMRSREFDQLADGYNLMADQLEQAVINLGRSERELQNANSELLQSSEILRDRGEAIELLGGMAHRMQAARTDEELAQVIRVFVPRVLPGVPGALYAHNNSRNLLIPIAGWGGMDPGLEGFAPDQCWALRRGQSHFVVEPGSDIVCSHVAGEDVTYHCEPLLAGGEVIGTLYLAGRVDVESHFRLTVMAENIASALVNHRLQRGLREQTIRDPLTGLFNRRYMEETLALEIARARRSGAPLSLVMCDIDHFKRFNDDFGHDAGDAVLQAVASEMRSRFRDGDVVCRYGGEEFTIIAPGTHADALATRVEIVRDAITKVMLQQSGRALGSTSMSFGIATWNEHMDRSGSMLIQTADAALYRAKREGRNRVVMDSRYAA